MCYIKKVLFLIYFFFPLIVQSQEKRINLPITFHTGFGPFGANGFFAVRQVDTSGSFKNVFPVLKGIPKDLKNIKKYYVWFEPYQFAYQNFIAGKISKEDYTQIQEMWQWVPNEKKLSKNQLKCYVNIIYGVNDNNEKLCIIDINNNLDFSDDTLFAPIDSHSSSDLIERNIKRIDCQRLVNSKIIYDKCPIVIAESNSSLKFSMAGYATSKYKVNGKVYPIAVCPQLFYSRSYVHSELAILRDTLSQVRVDPNNELKDGDYFEIDKVLYHYIGVDMTKNILVLEKAKYTDKYSSQLGFYAPEFKGLSMNDSVVISLNDYKGKYLLLDFWGTWCLPCRAEMPFLKRATESFDKGRFEILGIVSSDKKEIVSAYVNKEGIKWPQILSDKITELYKVTDFPSSFLIDPKGKIIAKNLRGNELLAAVKKILDE